MGYSMVNMERTDCEVCKKLIKEKHRNVIWWKVCCIIFGALSLVLGILYFGGGAVVTETEVKIEKSFSDNTFGDDGTVIIGGQQINDSYNGIVENKDYTPIICITVIAGVAILVAGGVLIANHVKKDY